MSSVAWQYRSAIRSWAPTACGQTLHVAPSTRYAFPRSLPRLSLVRGVTSPAREAAPDSDALPAVPLRAATSLACSSEIAGPRFVGVVHSGRVQRWALAGSGVGPGWLHRKIRTSPFFGRTPIEHIVALGLDGLSDVMQVLNRAVMKQALAR